MRTIDLFSGCGGMSLGFQNAGFITRIQPKWFVMENVDQITKSQTFERMIEIFKKSRYGLSSSVINASYCGVPQSRKRYFLIGQLDGEDDVLNYYLNKNQSNVQMSIFDYLGDTLGIEYIYRHPRSYQRRAVFSIHEPSPTIRGVNRPLTVRSFLGRVIRLR